jgi:hypothetical protein
VERIPLTVPSKTVIPQIVPRCHMEPLKHPNVTQ